MDKDLLFKLSYSFGALTGPGDKETLYNLADKYIKPGGLAIEVGTWNGGSAVIIGEICRQKNARLLCIDAYSGNVHSFDEINYPVLHTVIDYLIADSERDFKYLSVQIADLILIDGDHHIPKVEADIEHYFYVLKTGGVYLMHDYTNPCDVKVVADKFFGESKIIKMPDSFGVVEK